MRIPLRKILSRMTATACCVMLIPFTAQSSAPELAEPRGAVALDDATKIPNDQLDSLVAPIALYPDPLLAQVLAATTYPLEIIQLQQWLAQHKELKDQALVDAVQQQDWDPSVQGLAALPDVVKRLADDIKWTTDLGNAFLAQQSDVMDAVQRMRAKAQGQGNLKSTEQVKVETQTVESKQVIVIQQANPQVIYVPSYNPVVVYGPPIYPYPPIYYPPPGYYAGGLAIAFGVGVAMGSYWRGGWGYGCGWGWGRSNVNININNTYVSHYNKTNINNANINRGGNASTLPANRAGGSNTWQHNPQHRGGTPYSNKVTANQYGGTTRGSSQAARQDSARQQQVRQQGGAGNRGGTSGGQAGARPSQGQVGGGQGGARPNQGQVGAGQAGNRAGASGGQAGARPSQGQVGAGQAGNRAGTAGAGGADRVGNRTVSSGGASGSSRGGGGFGGEGGLSSSGGGARASSSRGASSMGGGGVSRGGGGRRP